MVKRVGHLRAGFGLVVVSRIGIIHAHALLLRRDSTVIKTVSEVGRTRTTAGSKTVSRLSGSRRSSALNAVGVRSSDVCISSAAASFCNVLIFGIFSFFS